MTKAELVGTGSDERYVRRNEKDGSRRATTSAALFLSIVAERQKPKQSLVSATGGLERSSTDQASALNWHQRRVRALCVCASKRVTSSKVLRSGPRSSGLVGAMRPLAL
ncbi:hypothetical protein [Rhizobium mongolense]|uniref:hypothetical protein n=1 Tax=Rhizobium mongolense TaxID=57676 RepID=UPI00389AB316